jgi:hypothetical protein
MMEAGIGDIPQNLTPDIINELYEWGTDNLKMRLSYVFSNNKLHHDDWVVATWAMYLSRSIILKKGTDDDIRNFLPTMKLSNRPRPIGVKHRNGAAMVVVEMAGP